MPPRPLDGVGEFVQGDAHFSLRFKNLSVPVLKRLLRDEIIDDFIRHLFPIDYYEVDFDTWHSGKGHADRTIKEGDATQSQQIGHGIWCSET